MTTPVSSALQGVTVKVDVPDHHEPLDIENITGIIQAATQDVTRQLARLKFARDIRLLRAALYALGSTLTMEEAIKDIEDDMHAEKQANALLHGFLAARGWKPYEAVDGSKSQWEDATGMLSGSIGGKRKVEASKKYAGDVIVCLHSGLTLVAEARDAYLFDWVEVGSSKPYTLRPHDEWWFVKNIKEGIGYDPDGEKQRAAFRAVTVPEVPADLTALLARIPEES